MLSIFAGCFPFHLFGDIPDFAGLLRTDLTFASPSIGFAYPLEMEEEAIEEEEEEPGLRSVKRRRSGFFDMHFCARAESKAASAPSALPSSTTAINTAEAAPPTCA